MIEFTNVVKRYPGSPDVLKNVSFAVQPGEFVYLTGHSGAGKSTVMRLIAAIERPTAGTVLVHRQNVGRLSERSIPFLRRQLGMVLQDHRLLFDRSVFDNVMLPLQIAGMDRREAARRARAALDKAGLLGREKSNPIALSGEYLLVRNDREAVCYELPVAGESTASATRAAAVGVSGR